jgi:DNA recombination-dependent growth factor C
LSYKLFFVQGDLPSDWRTSFLEAIRVRAFQPLTPEASEEESSGWVPIERPLEGDFVIDNVHYNDFLNLGLRTDKYVLPGELERAHLFEATRAYLAQRNKDRLNKFERDDLKEMVRHDLKAKALPQMKVVDMSWQLSSMRVRFWSQSAKAGERFQELFEETFGLSLLPANPYLTALELDLPTDAIERLAVAEASNFVAGTKGVA